MVRADDWDDRERILNILINGERPCRRLFLDYHGLRLLWGWMLDLPLTFTPDSETQTIRNDSYHLLVNLFNICSNNIFSRPVRVGWIFVYCNT